MKFKKLVAALSAVTMLGSLAIAVPMSASAADTIAVNSQPQTSTNNRNIDGVTVGYTISNSSIWYLGSYDINDIESITAYVGLCPNGSSESPTLKIGYSSAEGTVNNDYCSTNSSTIRSGNNLLWSYEGKTTEQTGEISTLADFDTVTFNRTDKNASGTVNLFIYATAQGKRAYISYVTITLKTTTAYFSFEGDESTSYNTVTVTAKKGEKTDTKQANITTITGGSLYLGIADVPKNVTITNVTLE